MRAPYYGNPEYAIGRHCREDEMARLKAAFGGRRVCLVAQGESAIAERLGELVDGHDLVVRMNRFQLAGFEPFIGSRTDAHAFTNNSVLHSRECRDADWFYCSDGFLRIDDPAFNDGNLLFWSRPPGDYDEFLNGKWPTTGLRILLDVLAAGASEVTLIGYDFYQNSQYYFSPLQPGTIAAVWVMHDPAREREYVLRLMETDKRIVRL